MNDRGNRRFPQPTSANLYVAGAVIHLHVEDAQGRVRARTFRLRRRLQGGFASDVWQARDLDSGAWYALKFFAAQHGLVNRVKKWLRDAAHLLVFQSPYPYRVSHAAARHALLVRKLLHALSAIDENRASVVDAEGLFWEPGWRTYGLVLPWVEGRGPWYARADAQLFARWHRPSGTRVPPVPHETPRWLARQRQWMTFARRWGFHEHVAQIYAARRWGGAWLSLTNVLYAVEPARIARGRRDVRHLQWIDVEPAFPHVLWCFGFHVRLAAEAWRRGVFPSFDRVDVPTLGRALGALDVATRRRHAAALTTVATWAAQLGGARRLYDRQRCNVWQHRWASVTDAALRRDIREGWIAYWRRSQQISARGARRLTAHAWAWSLAWMFGCVPLMGGRVRRYVWHERYRQHLNRLWTDNAYMWRVWRRGARVRLWIWQREGRVPLRQEHSPVAAWWRHAGRAVLLPVAWHRWTADARFRRRGWVRLQRFLWNERGYRQYVYRSFFLRLVEEEYRRHRLTPVVYGRLAAAIHRPALACYLEGHYLYALPKVFFWLLTIALALLGVAARAPVMLVAALFIGGLYREVVTWWLALRHPRVPLGAALLVAWVPKFGSLACTVQMVRSLRGGERQLLFIGLRRLVTAASRAVPFLGGEGTLAEYYAVRCCLDLPYSVWRWCRARRSIAARR